MSAPQNGTKPRGAPRRPPLTHFLCLPLVTPASRSQLEASLKRFKEAVGPDRRRNATTIATDVAPVHPKAFRPVGTLHLTLGVMSLDQRQLAEAEDLLRSLPVVSMLSSDQHPANTGAASLTNEAGATMPGTKQNVPPLKIDLKGLSSMHAPENTSILYCAPADATSRILPFCQAVQTMFREKGFLVDDHRPLKLHATIVNTIYAKGRKGPSKHQSVSQAARSRISKSPPGDNVDDRGSTGHGPNANAPLKMDARSILETFGELVWAEGVMLDRLAICEMGAKKKFDDSGNIVGEEYEEVACVSLPS